MAGKGEYLVGIDSSTQSTKACVWTVRGRRVAHGAAPLRVRSPKPGWAEQDPRSWWRSTRRALREALADVDVGRIEAVGIAYQRETFSLCDARGAFVRPGILWLDVRADREVEQLRRQVGAEAYHRRTGKPLDVTSALARLVWLARHEPQSLRHTARWVDVGGELAYRLTGRYATCVAGTDTCGLVDLRKRCWIGPYLARVGLRAGQLPDLAQPGEIIGCVTRAAARQTLLPEGLPVVAAGGDGSVFALGIGSVRSQSLSLTLGTSIVLGLTSPRPVIAPLFRTLIAPAGGYLLECVLQSGTYLLRWFADRFAPSAKAAETYWDARIARIPPGCEGLITLPHWWGVRFPRALPDARGLTLGWSNHHGPAHFYRSLLEGLTLEIRRFDVELRKRFSRRIGRVIRVGGGGAESTQWPQILADVLGWPVALGRRREATALGAAILAGVGAGLFPDASAACKHMVAMRMAIQPNRRNARFYRKLYETVYVPLFAATADLSQKLRGLGTAGQDRSL